MLHLAVQQHQAIAIGLEGEVLELAAAAVEAHQTASLAEDRGELVHDTAVDAAVVVLGSLSGEHHIPLRDLVLAEDVVQTAGEAALHSGTRRHTCTKGHVASKGDVEALDGNAELLELLSDAVDIACPRSLGAGRIVELEVYTILQVDSVGHHGIFSTVGAHLGCDALVDSTWEDEATIIVGMLTNEVDTAG